jgi:hypothetical protein
MTASATAILNGVLRALGPTGVDAFEGLVATLVGRLTGYRFILAASGREDGRDMRAPTEFGTHVAVECKRYLADTVLDECSPRKPLSSLESASQPVSIEMLGVDRQPLPTGMPASSSHLVAVPTYVLCLTFANLNLKII